MKKTRVLYISYDCITEPLTESQVLPYLRGLSKENGIYLFTFNKKPVSAEFMEEVAKEYGLEKVFALRYHKNPSLPATLFDVFCGAVRGFFIVVRYKIAFIHARSYVACAIALVLKKICGIKYLFDIRGLLADERADSGDWDKGSISYRLVKFYEKVMIKEAAKIIVLSHAGLAIVEDISAGAKDRTSVIPTCVDTELFTPPPRYEFINAPLKFIYVGSLGTWYMLSEMLEFFKTALRIANESRLTVITWSDQGIVNSLVREKGIDENRVIVKREPHGRVPFYMKENDISLFFIKPVFSKKVSCPTKFAESLSCGLPIITNSGIGDLDDYIKKYSVGAVVNDFNVEGYESAIRTVIDMLKDRGALSLRCRSLAVKEFSLASGIEKYKDIYGSMIL